MILLDKIKPSDLWYVIGYFAADGSLSIDGRHLNITSKDEEHLLLIKQALKLKSKIGKKYRSVEKTKEYSQLQFSDVKFYKFLQSIGFTIKKSLTLGPIRVGKDHFGDFLRGIIDGDGSISSWIHRTNRRQQWSLRVFSGSLEFINWLQAEINTVYQIEGKIYTKKQRDRINSIHLIKFGKKAATEILKQIYYKNCLSLKRKHLKARLCLQS